MAEGATLGVVALGTATKGAAVLGMAEGMALGAAALGVVALGVAEGVAMAGAHGGDSGCGGGDGGSFFRCHCCMCCR